MDSNSQNHVNPMDIAIDDYLSERFKECLKAFLNFVKNIYEKEVKKFFGIIAVPILIMLLVLCFIL